MKRRVRRFTLREHPLEEHCKYLRDLGLRGWTDERPLPVEKLVEVKTVFKIVLDPTARSVLGRWFHPF